MATEAAIEWVLDGVLDELSRIDKTMKDRQFAFILGAGASFTSGIPTGRELAQRWLRDLHMRECVDQSPLEEWIAGCGIGSGKLTWQSAADHYPQVFERRFDGDREAGYAELETAMEGKSPSLGYSLLAEIIQHTRHKVVVTTNFDNLVADALAMHAHQSPLVVAHESLAGFVRPQLRRPLVAKIHRDLFLHPISDLAGVSTLEQGWKIALKKLFQYFTPIVVGYGGNDGSLMDLLAGLEPGDIAGRMVWCYRDGSPPPDKAMAVLKKHKGLLVKIAGFDEFMLQLAAKLVPGFDVAAIAERTATLGQERAERYREQAGKLREALARGSAADQKVGEVLSESVRAGSSWFAWEVKAQSVGNPEDRRAVYEEGLQQFPRSVELMNNYAKLLANQLKDYAGAESMYQRAIELDPDSVKLASNYAFFLRSYRKDYPRAKSMYEQALRLAPNRADIHANYAAFLANQLGQPDAAEAMYRRALELEPTHATVVGNFAIFLARYRPQSEEAEAMFKRGAELDPGSAKILGSYATFLAKYRRDYDGAEAMYAKALELEPGNTDNLVNRASALLARGDNAALAVVLSLVRRALELSSPRVSQTVAEGLLYGALVHQITPDPASEDMLGRLKGALLEGYRRGSWDFSDMFATVLPRIPESHRKFFVALGEAILDEQRLSALDGFQLWRDTRAVDAFAR